MTTTPLQYAFYFVGPDETLAIVAKNYYGDDSQQKQDLIYEANKDRFLCSDKTLRQGMTLRIPPVS
jgi:nucleoid-associated protein YgaU